VKNVFLTGASSGIGLAIAHLLTSRGYEVWGTARAADRLPRLPRFHPVVLDLYRLESIGPTLAQAEQAAGHFDALINNAGAAILGPWETQSLGEIRAQFDLLFHAPHALICGLLPGMRSRNYGTILNITSLAAQFPLAFLGPYSAAKAALGNYTQGLRLELSGTSVQACEIQPGDIATPFHQRLVQKPLPEDYRINAEAAMKVMDRDVAAGPPPELVAHVVLQALSTRQLPPVLTVGSSRQAHFFPVLARLLPAHWVEVILRKHYGLRPPPRPEPPAEMEDGGAIEIR
jgi:short-subunit dehydrogenase